MMVGARGFEPPTARPPDVYATKLRYTPTHQYETDRKQLYPYFWLVAPKQRG